MKTINKNDVWVVYDVIENDFDIIYLLYDDAKIRYDELLKEKFEEFRKGFSFLSDEKYINHFKIMTNSLYCIMTLKDAIEKIKDESYDSGAAPYQDESL